MIKEKKGIKKRLLSVALTAMMTIPLLAGINGNDMDSVQAATKTLHNPRRDADGIVTWDLVYFGRYAQSDASGETTDPIKWRVLSVDGQNAFLVADSILDMRKFNTTFDAVAWEKSTVRSWLNAYDGTMNTDQQNYAASGFINRAFDSLEQAAIKTTTVNNSGNEFVGVPASADTSDKIFLLSYDDVTNPAYGFNSDYDADDLARKRINTAYVAKNYNLKEGEKGNWWLRTPAELQKKSMYIVAFWVCRGDTSAGNPVDHISGICPALHLDLSKTNVWSYAGTVNSKGTTIAGDQPPVRTEAVNNTSNEVIKTDSLTNANYALNAKSKTAQYKGPVSKTMGAEVPDTVTISGTKYKVTSIADDAFTDNTYLESVTIDDNVTTIGKNAFSGCINLKTVKGGKNVTTIGENAFYNCTRLSKITIYAKVKKIGKQAFYGDKKLKNIIVKTSKLTKSKVGSDAFKGIHTKATIKVPKKKLKSYKSIFKAKGAGSKVKYKK